MKYYISEDYYTCSNYKKLKFEKIINRRNQYDFKSEIRVYLCKDCETCKDSKECIKYKNKSGLKSIYVSKRFDELRKESEDNIVSEEGIIESINRSIQAEGVFSYIKSGMNYLRFRHCGMDKIISEIKLLSLAINLRKLSNKLNQKKPDLSNIK